MIEKKHETSTAGSARVLHRGTRDGFEVPPRRDVSRTAKNSRELFSISRFSRTGPRREEGVGPRSKGATGPSEVPQRDPDWSGAVSAGRDDDELRWAQKHVPEDTAHPRPKGSVFRKTELHNASQGSPEEETAKTRKRIRRDLNNPGSGVTLRPFETAVRDLVCSIIGQQDLAEEKLVLQIADLQQQIYDLQQTVAALEQKLPAQASPPTATERPEGYV